jgi:hypothetical protein
MSNTTGHNGVLWPHGLSVAVLVVPTVWILLVLVLSITERWTAWPEPGSRTIVVYCALSFSLAPLVLWLLDFGRVGLAGPGAGIGTRQSEAGAEIERNRVAYQDMAWRAKSANPNATVDTTVDGKFKELADKAGKTTDGEALDALVEEAEALAQRRAYLCPDKEISTEARSHLFSLVDWGVSSKKIDSLKEVAAPALDVEMKDVAAGRGGLHVIFEEYDAWDSYIDEYNANTSFWASTFLGIIAVLATLALIMMLGFSWKVLALVLAAIAGATASVIARLPGLTSYGEWVVNLRAYQARIGTGIVGSLVGIGLLGSGLITIALPKDWKSADTLLEACLAHAPSPASVAPTSPAPGPSGAAPAPETKARCDSGGMLFLIAVTMLLGFSERLLTSLEGRVVGSGTPAAGKT